MRPYQSYAVVPQLPKPLENLRELAWNLRFSWDPSTRDLFRMVDSNLWTECGSNPVLFLGRVPQSRLEECATDPAILANLERVWDDYAKYRQSNATWYARAEGAPKDGGGSGRIGYFSAEFGLSHSLPLYSGGLGVLAGDHLKAASDLGIPLVGVGLLYQRGYFQQYLNSDGWQQENYPTNDFHNLPVRQLRDAEGNARILHLPLDNRTLQVQLWQVDVGRVPLILLDTNVPENSPEHRTITYELYGGDSDTRLLQEYVLGVGGVRALDELGLPPEICHMNEGHSAFLVFERIRMAMERENLSFEEARAASASSCVFTTHTPVHAAIDLFSSQQMLRIFPDWVTAFGIAPDELMNLGREKQGDENAPFNMAVFALRNADAANGVSKLHGKVSRGMWKHLWKGVPEDEVPITSVTNGVHMQTWVSRGMRELFDRYLGPRWARDPGEAVLWEAVERIPAEVLWRTHEVQRQRLVSYVRERMRKQLAEANATPVEMTSVNEVLDAGALTIGFARRFAPYKRGNLILRDLNRLLPMLTDPKRPVQFIIAGKSHPRDEAGKRLIQEIVQFSRDERVRGRVVFVEDYDMDVAAHLVHGVDVWLNNPRRPLEASGTSGMKAAANGALNMSVLDGWWDEAATEHLGWSIGNGEIYSDSKVQDDVESGALYDLLEHEVVPLFFDRGRDNLPRGWIRMMRAAIRGLVPVFNTNRMVAEYAQRAYFPSLHRTRRLRGEDWAKLRDLAAWEVRVENVWDGVRIVEIDAEPVAERAVGDTLPVRARIAMAGLTPDALEVQLYHGEVDPDGQIIDAEAVPMVRDGDGPDGSVWFRGEVPCRRTGHRGYAVRVLPYHTEAASQFRPCFVRWSSDPVSGSRSAPVAV